MSATDLISDGTLTITEAQRFSGLGRTFLYSLMERGELRFAKVGKRRLIPKKALLELLRTGLVGERVGK